MDGGEEGSIDSSYQISYLVNKSRSLSSGAAQVFRAVNL